jgi:predicted nuclease of predicted toxin-antitoxin system
MTIWLDAHLPPALVPWLESMFGVTAVSVRDLGFAGASDTAIFAAARHERAIVMTKDADFPELVERLGPPPQVAWIRCGNTSNAALRIRLVRDLPEAIARLSAGEAVVEIGSLDAE